MAIGVPYDVFYHGDCDEVDAYWDAFKLKRRQFNEQAWLQGKYVCDAFAVVIGNALRKKNDQPTTYMDEPYEMTEKIDPEEAKRKESKKLYNQMKNVIKAFNSDSDRKKRNLQRLKQMNK